MSSSGALFPSNISASRGGSSSKSLVEFRAGKMSLRGGTVSPDQRRGLVYVQQSDDSLIHFCWKDRSSGLVEEDLIIFPDDCEFKHVPQCTSGRVYVLKFKSGSRRLFFWMQEPKSEKDEELTKKVNEYINNPPAPGSLGSSSSSHGLSSDLAALSGEGGLQSLLGNMDQQQLMQLMGASGLGGLGALAGLLGSGHSSSSDGISARTLRTPRRTRGSSTTCPTPPGRATSTATPSPDPASLPLPPEMGSTTVTSPTKGTSSGERTSSESGKADSPGKASTESEGGTGASGVSTSQPIQLSDLQSILTNMNVPAPDVPATIDLASVLSPDVMAPILSNPEIQQRLIPFLPTGENLPQTANELQSTMSSPQFQQAMSMFSAALASGQLGPLMSQFGLPESAVLAAGKGDLEGFAQAMQAQEGGNAAAEKEEATEEAKEEEEEDMSLD
uniref:proteasomal ubiquitin receptor ADRM1 n=1 Tax=Myxine glutinosa TaxID=7769 RepID=UPI00358DE693